MAITDRQSRHVRAWARSLLATAGLIGVAAAPAAAESPKASRAATSCSPSTRARPPSRFRTGSSTCRSSSRARTSGRWTCGRRPGRSTSSAARAGSTSSTKDGIPRALSAGPFTPALLGANFALDVDPTTDTLRVISDTGQNLRLDPETGMVIAVDTPLNPDDGAGADRTDQPGVAGEEVDRIEAGHAAWRCRRPISSPRDRPAASSTRTSCSPTRRWRRCPWRSPTRPSWPR